MKISKPRKVLKTKSRKKKPEKKHSRRNRSKKQTTILRRKRAPIDPLDPREQALQLMKEGKSQAEAAKIVGTSVSSIANFRRRNTASKFKNGRWKITDSRPVPMMIASHGQIYAIHVASRAKSAVGHYWNAVNRFLATNDKSHLKPFQGKRFRDANLNYHVLETDPNKLRILDSIGELSFVEIYSDVVN